MIIHVAFLPLYSRKYASSRYRIFQFLPYLQQKGFRLSVLPAPERRLIARLEYIPRLVKLAQSADVLFIQKRMLPDFLLRWLRQRPVRLIFDIDDAVYLRPKQKRRIDAMMVASDVIIAGNEILAAYARQLNPNVVVIPSVVDCTHYRPAERQSNSPLIVGWIGNNPNRGDFTDMPPILDWLGKKYREKVLLRFVSSHPLNMESAVAMEWIPWTLEGSLPALQSFDVGIMPLPDTSWNQGKCGFKLIQYLATGVPSVASPVGVNAQIVENAKTGFLAGSAEVWQQGLATLLDNEELRTKMGRAGRNHIQDKYSVTAVLPFLEAVLSGETDIRL